MGADGSPASPIAGLSLCSGTNAGLYGSSDNELGLRPMTVLMRGLRPRTPSTSGSLALARPSVHSLRS